jgi:hypothetical protein
MDVDGRVAIGCGERVEGDDDNDDDSTTLIKG